MRKAQRLTWQDAKIICVALMLLMAFGAALGIVAPVAAYAAGSPVYITVRQVCHTFMFPEEEVFTYKLRALDLNNPMPPMSIDGEYIFEIKGNRNVQIGPLAFDTPGVFEYELTQSISEPDPGIIYDEQVYMIEIIVDESVDVSMIVTKEDGTKAEEILFTNGLMKVEVDPIIRKIVYGNPPADSTFAFKMEAQNPSDPMPPDSVGGVKTIYITGSGLGDFGDIHYHHEGVYRYIIYEVDTGLHGYTYDTTVFTITDTVKKEGGQLVASRVITDSSGREVTDIVFVNRYNADSGSAYRTRPPTQTLLSNSRPLISGLSGPKTGDETDDTFYIMLFAFGGVLAISAAAYLIVGEKRREGVQKHEEI